MSARKANVLKPGSGPQQKTLFSFFGKTPQKSEDTEEKQNESAKENFKSVTTPLRSSVKSKIGTPSSVDRRVRFSMSEEPSVKEDVEKVDDENDDEEVFTSSTKSKRRSVILWSDDENEEPKTPKKAQKRRAPSSARKGGKKQRRGVADDEEEGNEEYDDDDSFVVSDEDLDEDDDVEADFDEEDSDNDSGRGSRQKKGKTQSASRARGGKQSATPRAASSAASFGTPVSSRTKEKLNNFQSSASDEIGERDTSQFPHLTAPEYSFLRPQNICDANRKKPDNPDYDPTSLYVPESFLAKQTPGLKQWWQMKSNYFDTVLCFKVGKFYELYHMDAITAVNELGLIFMRGEVAHAGFPEQAYSRYADQLVQRGFKIGRIEQTETPAAAAERAKEAKMTPKSPASERQKVVRRELCQIVSAGTRTTDMMCGGLGDSSPGCLIAVAENHVADSDKIKFGLAFVDTTIGLFHLSQFTDDRARSSLRTVIASNRAAQIITERKGTSEETLRVLATAASSAIRETVPTSGIAWNAEKTVKDLAKSDYFRPSADAPEIEWPPAIAEMLIDPSSGVPRPNEDSELSLAALGALVVYLRRCMIDETLLSQRQFVNYLPPDVIITPSQSSGDEMEVEESRKCSEIRNTRLIVDSITLRNLDLMENSSTGTLEGTLFELLDSCSSEFGRRQLREWISAPLTRIADITDRQKAIAELGHDMGLTTRVRKLLSKLPDLDRSLSKMHTFGHPSKSKGHPDSRAVLFEDDTYRKRRIDELVLTMKGFRTAVDIFKEFSESVENSDGFESRLLRRCSLSVNQGGMVPEIKPVLDELESLFDLTEAKQTGKITPRPGLSPAYDEAINEVAEIMSSLEDLRESYKKQLRLQKCEFFGTARNRYQLEIPENVQVSDEFTLTSKRKGFRRYKTDEIDELFASLMQAEDRRETAMRDSMRATFAKFDEYFPKWQQAVRCLATIDCLLALSIYSSSADFTVPEFIDANEGNNGKPFISIERGAHPCLLPKIGSSLIANDTFINYNSNASSLILTGPNMGGKSTLMRQVGLLVVLSHLGCSVPASSMRLSPVDRIFTRMGASDRILAGESTFYVELAETSVILQRATEHSLVLLDELGRGTATYDGLSVAAAVLEYLAGKIGCRTIFSTHYHLLVSTIASENSKCSNNVSLCHMACKVDNDKMDEGGVETITFLYQLIPGACPRSYGFNAARLAGLPLKLIECASAKAAEFEREERVSRRYRSTYKAESIGEFFEKLKIVDRH